MDYYKRFDKYFLYNYFDNQNKKVGVFRKDTPAHILKEAEDIFDIVESED